MGWIEIKKPSYLRQYKQVNSINSMALAPKVFNIIIEKTIQAEEQKKEIFLNQIQKINMTRIILDAKQAQLIKLRSETADLKKQADELEKIQIPQNDTGSKDENDDNIKEKYAQSLKQEQDDLDLKSPNFGMISIVDRRYNANNELINQGLTSRENPDYYSKMETTAQMYQNNCPRYFALQHLAAVRDVALHPKFMLLASVSDDGTAALTDVSHAMKPKKKIYSQQITTPQIANKTQELSLISTHQCLQARQMETNWYYKPSRQYSINKLKDTSKQRNNSQSNIKYIQQKPQCIKFLPYLESTNDKSRKQLNASAIIPKRMHYDLGCLVTGNNNGKITVMALPDPKMHMADTLNKLEKNKMFEFDAHSDAIWSIDESSQTNGVFSGSSLPSGQKLTQTRIATASADGTVKLWNINTDGIPDQTDGNNVVIHHQMLQEFKHTPSIASSVVMDWNSKRLMATGTNMSQYFKPVEQIKDKWEDSDIPSAVIFDPINVANLIVGYVSGDLVRYDIEKGEYNWNQVGTKNQSERIISLTKSLTATHYQTPDTIPLLVSTNHGYLHIVDSREFQTLIAAGTNSGKVHIFDLRMGDKGQVGIVGERNPQSFHSPMFNEGITKIAAHLIHPLLVTAGADGIIKIFTSNQP
ncbi:MAG: hypothetical protein EZS28_013153 [Streblomastix strix]|uniref:Uncharacterized protein n=1 Tax=Streblomastix strix TaxID=222440 RepID=A0A5J4WAB9_9EUKA|nr:MAG: hypothetical protein EZS28_013153 [Streblomastix strix]